MHSLILTTRHLSTRVLAIALLATLLLALVPGSALAEGVVFVGTVDKAAPPATLGPYTMTPFPPDLRPEGAVTTVPAPSSELVFSTTASHYTVGFSWGSWGHGYAGDVYYFSGALEASLTLPANTRAFYLYIDGNSYSTEEVYAIVDGVTYTLPGGGLNGATYFGFYSLSAPITTITFGADAISGGVCIGEFGIYTDPAPVEAPVTSPRADVAAVIYGGWSGIPVQAWVGGTAQPTLYTAPNHEGHAAVLFTFWPPEGAAWKVGVSPALAAGLDASRWEIKLVGMTTGGKWVASPTVGDVTITQGSQIVLYYQLVDKG